MARGEECQCDLPSDKNSRKTRGRRGKHVIDGRGEKGYECSSSSDEHSRRASGTRGKDSITAVPLVTRTLEGRGSRGEKEYQCDLFSEVAECVWPQHVARRGEAAWTLIKPCLRTPGLTLADMIRRLGGDCGGRGGASL